MTEANEEISTKVVTSIEFPVRVSYFKSILGKPIWKEGKLTGKTDFGTQILIPKKDEVTNTRIKQAINAVANEKWPKGAPKGLKISYRDGDLGPEVKGGVPDSAEAGEPPYGGNHFITLTADRRPTIINVKGVAFLPSEEISPDLIVSGDYVVVGMNCYAWANDNGNGISWGVKSIQQYRKGEPLAKASNSTPDFIPLDLSGDTPGEVASDKPGDIMDLV